MAPTDRLQLSTRRGVDVALAKLVEDHAVHLGAVVRGWDHAGDAVTRETLDIELLLHRVASAQQRDATAAGFMKPP